MNNRKSPTPVTGKDKPRCAASGLLGIVISSRAKLVKWAGPSLYHLNGRLRMPEPLYLLLRLFQVHTKILILRFKGRVFLLQSRHLRFCLRQTLAQDCGEGNLFQYVCDYAHSVLMPNDKSSPAPGDSGRAGGKDSK